MLIEQWAERLGPCRNLETLHGPGAVVIKKSSLAFVFPVVSPEAPASSRRTLHHRILVALGRDVVADEAVLADGLPPRA